MQPRPAGARFSTAARLVNPVLVAATLINYVTYTTWTLLNKLQFSPPSGGANRTQPSTEHHHEHAHDHSLFVPCGVAVPLFVTGVQMVLAGLVAAFAIFVLGIQRRKPLPDGRHDPTAPVLMSWETLRQRILPLGVARCIDIGCGNAALLKVSVALQQVIKALLPVFVSLLSVTVLNKAVAYETWLTMVPIVGGTVAATIGGKVSPSLFGVGLALVSCFARSFKCVLNAKLLQPASSGKGVEEESADQAQKKAPLLPLEILLLEAPTSGLLLLALSALIEGHRVVDNAPQLMDALPINLLGGLLMFANQASYITVIQQSSAVSCQVLMNIKMLLVIVLSVHIFGTPLRWWNGVGIFVAAAGCVAYAVAEGRPQRKVHATKGGAEAV
jgi:drug/metabolite transporter (DMT)-like permease